MNDQGILYIVAAPSGAGKTSLVRKVLDTMPRIQVSVSHTTREIRPGEVDGRDYHFVSKQQFASMVEQSSFLEHAQVFGHHYGTSRKWVVQTLQQGIDIILEIDWQGARQIRQLFSSAQSIYILPPSMEALQQRLQARGQDSQSVITLRMNEAKSEMSHTGEFDYLLINNDFQSAVNDFKSIITTNRLKMERQVKIQQKILAELTHTR